ncbi:MAG: FAD-binding protein [Acidobacteriia bacterium]|nr:FAD-binding protein [Terriglobia bacterium]
MKQEILDELRGIVGSAYVLSEPEELLAYECDGFALHRHPPDAVLLPASSEEVARIIGVARKHGIPFVPRGAGTGLSGGALPRFGGMVLSLTRMKSIRELDFENRQAVVQPGVINLNLSQAASPSGYYFAPDPSSQMVSSIGGNLAENAGGPHCLKYGTTTNHVAALQVVLPSGETVELGSRAADCPGYDLVGVFTGSEGTLGVATRAVLKLSRLPQSAKTLLAAFESLKDACDAVSVIIARGIVPAALETMDRRMIRAVEAATHAGLPVGAGAVLIIELDGLASALQVQADQVAEICLHHGCQELRVAKSEEERQGLWKGRKEAFGTVGRMTRDLYLHDAVVPRNRLSEVVTRIYECADRAGVPLASLAHAGDGNLHPILLFDRKKEGEEVRILDLVREMLRICVDAGGTLSGEHGIGSEKNEYMDMLFSAADLEAMRRVRLAFDPDELCNPGKILPSRFSRYH